MKEEDVDPVRRVNIFFTNWDGVNARCASFIALCDVVYAKTNTLAKCLVRRLWNIFCHCQKVFLW
jgi:hypothetical protein